MTDPRDAAARYLANRRSGDSADGDSAVGDEETGVAPGIAAAVDRAAFIETAIQVAIRRGDFDDLPGAGKPLEGLGTHHDPDWWIRRKIETENLTGLGPPAILLRAEDRELNDQLDLLGRESDVRDVLEDFNRRVREARRQLQGGPPVVTAPRDVDAEVAAWAARRAGRSVSAPEPRPPRRRLFRRG
ncbi:MULTISPECIES: DUF1992 domain-containing protein [unclassified Microbacterium]|uniref:DnaJ family domain-containing protein n=1 Tax=unclassified Microbacterium TaxID=2609290 RepID=UPI001605456B|nr:MULTISPECIES: DUF1992 domain-containing protein [unclassified Microbacterium]QNA93806.1 DUF1992 domain-containing protein [Microbacterium sp. Se63.02b]QYM64101.1 DUF1992 domain-containing protein [Microbacterium sp. Se5.02b]